MTKRTIIFFLLLTSLVFPMELFAKIGVAVGTGKIQMDGQLKPGAVHVLPSINVTNKGDEGSEFEVLIQYHSNIPEFAPERGWFSFAPGSFWLDAQKSQLVEVKLELPVKTKPGDYFCYLEARPIDKSVDAGGAKIGVAAATKLNFTVRPANLFQGIMYKAASYWKHYAPWTYIGVAVLVLAIIILLLRRYMSFNIGIRLKKKTSDLEQGQKMENQNVVKAQNRDLLEEALVEVENYTSTLSHESQEQIFVEARSNKLGVARFLREGNPEVLGVLSGELRQVLMLSRRGLEKIKAQDERIYEQSLMIVTDGLLGRD